MVERALYVTATIVLLAGLVYAAVVDPRPCRMDDASAFCGSGARWSAVVGSALLAWILSYIARGLNNRKT